MKRRTAIAAAVAVAAAALGVVVATNGLSFGKHESERKNVSAYIGSVNLVQNQMGVEIGDVMRAYRAFTSKRASAKETVAQLAAAERTFRTLALRVSALQPPPEATKLAHLLSRLFDEEYAVADEVRRLAIFLPAFRSVTLESQTLSGELSKALARVRTPKPHLVRGTRKQIARARAAFAAAVAAAGAAQARAVDAYDTSLEVVLAQLGRLDPPRVMLPAYRAQAATLRATQKAGADLAAGLRSPRHVNAARLSRRFSEAARTAAAVGRQRAEIAAIKAYNARVKRIGATEQQVQNEVGRLATRLP